LNRQAAGINDPEQYPNKRNEPEVRSSEGTNIDYTNFKCTEFD